MTVSTLCVFCGSGCGADPAYADAARRLGTALARRGIRLVYGGGNIGLMGVLADATLAAGGRAIGVIPHALAAKELAHQGLTELHVVDSMHERKAMMADLSDAFIALPGGLGTLEEIFEVVTWGQLGIHSKPCGFLNVAGYYDRLISFLDFVVTRELIKPVYRATILVDDDSDAMLDRMATYEPPAIERWIRKEER